MLNAASNSNRFEFVESLARIREEWQAAANGDSLLDLEGNVGLFFADIVNGLGLRSDEQAKVLGPTLFQEMQELLNSPKVN